MMYQCGRCGLTRASGQEIGVIQKCKCPWEFVPPAPPQRTWVGLTDKEIDELWMSHHDDFGNALSATDYERAIEAKLMSKNK